MMFVFLFLTCFTLYARLQFHPSTSPQMTQLHAFSWLSIPYAIVYMYHISVSFICWWTFRLLPHLGYYKQRCCEQWGTCVFLNYNFLSYVPKSGSYGSPILSFLRTLHTVLHSGCINLHSHHAPIYKAGIETQI